MVGMNWKPVTLSAIKNRTATVSGGNFIQNHNWYNEVVRQANDRVKQLDQYDQMDNITIDVSRALDMIAEDISSSGADDLKDFEVDFPNTYNPKKTEMRTLNEMVDRWKEVTGLDLSFYDYCRETVKYGATFFQPNKKDGTLKKLNPRYIIGYRCDKSDPDVITDYLYDPFFDSHSVGTNKQEAQFLPVDSLVILSVGNGPYGESVLKKVYRTWKQMQLLEDGVVIYRIVRAPERRIFYVDIGRLSGTKAEQYLKRFQARMTEKQRAKSNDITTEYNPQSMTEDFFVSQTADGRGSRVETLPGGDSTGGVTDLIHFNKKLAMGLRVPASYMDSSWNDQPETAQFNDGRLGMAYQSELRYVGYIKRIQRKFARILKPLFISFCTLNDIEVAEELQFKISPPQSFAEYRKNELANSLINTAVSAEQVSGLSKSFVLERYMDFDKSDIEENEYRVLLEKGFSKQEQGKLEEEVRYNIIYGDGSLNPKSSAPDDGSDTGGFGGGGF